MSSRFPPLAPQPPAQTQRRLLALLPWAELGMISLLGLLLLV